MNYDSKKEKAINRDQFMSKWNDVSTAFSFEHKEDMQNFLKEAINHYAPPEHEVPDLVLANSLKLIDDELATKHSRTKYFPDEASLTGNIPKWASIYLAEISKGTPLPQDTYREEF